METTWPPEINKTSVFEFSYICVNSLLEELIKFKGNNYYSEVRNV